ncbi:unnamed protein product, partial [marine sediment metagenome]
MWNSEWETASRKTLEQVQLERLQATLHRAYQRVPFYRKVFSEKGILPEDLRRLDDLKNFPFTTKNDLRDNYPYGMFAVPMRDIVRIHCSSGTTGKPTVVGYTKNDMKNWCDAMARVMVAGGVTRDDIVQITFG